MSEPSIREVVEGLQVQGTTESISYSVDVSRIGNGPTSPSLVVLDEEEDFANVTLTVAPGAPTVVGDSVICQPILGLEHGHIYYCIVGFDLGEQDLTGFFRILAER